MAGPVNWAGRAFAIGMLGLAGRMSYESWKGQQPIIRQNVDHFQTQADYLALKEPIGRYSGLPLFDRWAVKAKRLALYGPFGWRMTWVRMKENAQGAVNAVVDNIVPAGLGVATLFGFFGRDALMTPLRAINNATLRPLAHRVPWGALPNGVGRVANWGLRSTVSLLNRLFVGNHQNWRFTLPAAGILLFLVNRFNQVYNFDKQDEMFRGYTTGVNERYLE